MYHVSPVIFGVLKNPHGHHCHAVMCANSDVLSFLMALDFGVAVWALMFMMLGCASSQHIHRKYFYFSFIVAHQHHIS